MSTTTTQASPYIPVRDDWLARTTETILEPALPIEGGAPPASPCDGGSPI